MEIGAIGVIGTLAQNLVDQAKGAGQGNVTTHTLDIMDMIVMDMVMSLKFAIHIPAKVNSLIKFTKKSGD